MLLVKLTVDGVLQYLSNETLDIEHFYEAQIAGLSELRVATRHRHGGFAEPTYGKIDVLPSAFATSWPPPVSCSIVASMAVTGESDASIMTQGATHLSEITRDSVLLDIYGQAITTKVTDYVYNSTVISIFTVACATLGLTLNSTYSRNPSPAVDWFAEGERLLIDNLSDIAAFFTHCFYVEGTTLYLVDCLGDNGAVLALTEFDVFPSAYLAAPPVKKITAKYAAEIASYRIANTETQVESSFLGFAEIELRSVVDGADQTSVIGGSASAYNYHASYPPGNAVDDNAATDFRSSTISLSYMYWQFAFTSTPDPIIEYQITGHSTGPGYSPVSWEFQGYDVETSTWRTIKQEKTEADWTAGEVRKFSAPVPQWDVIVDGGHAYGNEIAISPVCHTARANINAALTNIKTVIERQNIRLTMPLGTVPKIGQKITLTDDSLFLSTAVWMRVRSVVWDFDNEQCVVEGEGELA